MDFVRIMSRLIDRIEYIEEELDEVIGNADVPESVEKISDSEVAGDKEESE